MMPVSGDQVRLAIRIFFMAEVRTESKVNQAAGRADEVSNQRARATGDD